eukprot:2989596-Ditylum_brightwellii.AAC.1
MAPLRHKWDTSMAPSSSCFPSSSPQLSDYLSSSSNSSSKETFSKHRSPPNTTITKSESTRQPAHTTGWDETSLFSKRAGDNQVQSSNSFDKDENSEKSSYTDDDYEENDDDNKDIVLSTPPT